MMRSTTSGVSAAALPQQQPSQSSTSTGISAAARPQQLPSQSLTFKPKSEWVHENEATVLLLYLPGFTMEQLTISPEYSERRVKVEGKRRLPSNRLLPVNETFNIPDDCDLSNMLKEFGKGTLSLKFPKVLPQQHKQTGVNAKSDEEEKKDQTDDANKKAADESNENGKDANKKAADESNENGKEYSSTPSMPQNNLEKKNQTDDANKRAADESNENGKKYSSTPSMPQNNLEKKNQTDDANKRAADESNKNGKEYSSTSSMPQNNLQPSSPDVNLMVNVGAALLIIMGLGASLFYTISHQLGTS
ncbi:hypothetical protein ES319_A05G414900v1 [Gossypium barbadense]|uniref:SHSP domain-containing protein n=2 Tax=Gossypium TaxID=3633 RepID=A0A5J5W1G5_GOSBA|nr:hypothetical protein ES319_A05G414900v1 [Gossypium barbadense]TYH20599.1 hypothetical protein ES288_A05G443000v1 [Gossypium darwinii]